MRLPLNLFRSAREAAPTPLRRLTELQEPPGSAGPDESPSRPAPNAPSPSELRAAELLQQLPRPSALSPAALGRIGAALAEPPRRRLSLLAAPVAATAAVAIVIGAAIPSLWPSLWRTRPADAPESLALRELRLPPGGLARLDGTADSAVLAVGPAVMHKDAAAHGLILDEGRLLLRAGTSALQLRVGRAAVTVPPRHVGEVVAHLGELVRVAAYVGDSGLRREPPAVRELVVREGTVWTEQGVLSVPAGCRAAVERAWLPGPMALPPCEPELAAATTPAIPAPVATAAAPLPPASEPIPAPVPAVKLQRPARPAGKPAAAPSRPAPVAVAAPASLLAEESRLLGAALHQLRQERDAAAALHTLDQYQGRFPSGSLLEEAQAARVDALLQLDRRTEALAVLDGARFQRLPRGGELLMLRGELRAAAGRCREADGDFLAALDSRPTAMVSERALYGRASCRARLGDSEGARQLLQQVLERFPTGRFAEPARRALSTLGAAR
ncbi:MAG: hypothetical protein U1A78_06020 [Polyangia bacterium]